MKIRKAFILTGVTFSLVIFLLPILHVNAIQTLESSSVHDVASVDLTKSVIAQEEGSQDEIQEVETLQESVEEAETLQEALEIIEDELTISEQQYEQAYLAFQNGDFRQSEESLKLIVSTLVSPDFQKLFEEDDCEDAPRFLIRGICRAAPGIARNIGRFVAEPVIRFTERLFLGESDFEFDDFDDDSLQAKLIESAERAHSTAVDSIRLLQKAIISQNRFSRADIPPFRALDALSVAELGRELELVRIAPLLDSSRGITNFTSDSPKGLSPDKIRDTANDWGATIVYFSVLSSEEIFIWVIPPDEDESITFRSVNLREDFNTSIEALTNDALRVASSYVDRGNSDKGQVVAWSRSLRSLERNQVIAPEDYIVTETELENGLRTLYRALIRPIENSLPQEIGSQIVLIPQGALFSVPFAALKKTSNEYLVDRYAVRLAPDLRSLQNSRSSLKKIPKKGRILLVGNPTMPSVQLTEDAEVQQLPSLPGADDEVRELASLFGARALTGEQATESSISEKATSSRIIHLATHGILDDQNSLSIDIGTEIQQAYGLAQAEYLNNLAEKLLPGAIALAPSGEKDGLLTSQEIIGLDLDDAKLVVLSACNTARGVSGDSSILGLPFALGTAGASRAMVSLWPVPDEPTKQLMILFYDELKKLADEDENIDPASALRDAMMDMRKIDKYKDPVNWAAFTLLEVKQE